MRTRWGNSNGQLTHIISISMPSSFLPLFFNFHPQPQRQPRVHLSFDCLWLRPTCLGLRWISPRCACHSSAVKNYTSQLDSAKYALRMASLEKRRRVALGIRARRASLPARQPADEFSHLTVTCQWMRCITTKRGEGGGRNLSSRSDGIQSGRCKSTRWAPLFHFLCDYSERVGASFFLSDETGSAAMK